MKTKIEDLSNQDLALKEKNGQLGSKIVQLEKKDANLMSMVNSLSQDVSDKNSALEKKNGEFTSKMVNLEAKNSHLMTNLTSLTEKDLDLETKLSELESGLDELKANQTTFHFFIIEN